MLPQSLRPRLLLRIEAQAIAAINAVEKEGGKVAIVVVLVDRQEGGRDKIEALGHFVLSLFKKEELLG